MSSFAHLGQINIEAEAQANVLKWMWDEISSYVAGTSEYKELKHIMNEADDRIATITNIFCNKLLDITSSNNSNISEKIREMYNSKYENANDTKIILDGIILAEGTLFSIAIFTSSLLLDKNKSTPKAFTYL